MVATDAVFTATPLPVPVSRQLGGVSLAEHPDGIFIIQPGLYFTGDGSKPKTRGVPRTAVTEREDDFLTAWQTMCKTGDENAGHVDIPVDVFVGLRQALHRNRPGLLGQWVTYRETEESPGKRVSFEWRTKRATIKVPLFAGCAETYPYPGGPDVHTIPYSREIGAWRELLRLDFEDQPDWIPPIGVME